MIVVDEVNEDNGGIEALILLDVVEIISGEMGRLESLYDTPLMMDLPFCVSVRMFGEWLVL